MQRSAMTFARLVRPAVLGCAMMLVCGAANAAEEAVYSGPQVGERLLPFKVIGVYDDDAGKEYDIVAKAEGKPTMLIFVHEFNRPSAQLTRVLSRFGAKRKDDLVSAVVRLEDDVTAGTEKLKVARHALDEGIPVVIAADGAEGPGSYGLNRNVQLTILVAKDNKVTGNFAIIQPSVDKDTPKILAEVVKLIGGEVPSVDELGGDGYKTMARDGKDMARGKKGKGGMRGRMRREGNPDETASRASDSKLTDLLRGVISKSASPEDVKKAAVEVEAYVKDNKAAQEQLGQITSNVVNSKVFANYGIAESREYLKKWSEKYGSKDKATSEKSN